MRNVCRPDQTSPILFVQMSTLKCSIIFAKLPPPPHVFAPIPRPRAETYRTFNARAPENDMFVIEIPLYRDRRQDVVQEMEGK